MLFNQFNNQAANDTSCQLAKVRRFLRAQFDVNRFKFCYNINERLFGFGSW